jgi:CxxC-x17-CxxC domain-containing protein
MTTKTEIICTDCDSAFLYSDAERAFRESRGLDRPTLCPDCRGKERARRNDDLIALYNKTESFEPFLFVSESRNGEKNGRSRDGRTLYAATCAACGAETKVPFIPRGDRPVYCRACYNARRGR